LNQQELEMQSILVRVLQEFLEAAVYTKQQQDTNLQEQSQGSPVQGKDCKTLLTIWRLGMSATKMG